MKLYLDTNIVIYYVERNPGWYSKVNARFSKLVPGRDRIVLSDLTIAECLVGPFKLANPKLEATYRRFFAGPDIDFALAARIRTRRAIASRSQIWLMDALHLATAIEVGCDVFLTNDSKLTRCTSIRIELLK